MRSDAKDPSGRGVRRTWLVLGVPGLLAILFGVAYKQPQLRWWPRRHLAVEPNTRDTHTRTHTRALQDVPSTGATPMSPGHTAAVTQSSSSSSRGRRKPVSLRKRDQGPRDPQRWRDLARETPHHDHRALTTASSSSDVGVFPSGPSVALCFNGTIMVIGSPHQGVYGNQTQGAAFVYYRDSGSWHPYQVLLGNMGKASDHFGSSVTMSEDAKTITVGATGVTGKSGHQVGATYVYKFNGSDWLQTQRLTPTSFNLHNSTRQEEFGASAALAPDGYTLVVGAPGRNGTTTAGHVYVYNITHVTTRKYFNLTQTITQTTAVSSGASTTPRTGFGRSVAISNDASYIVIGDPANVTTGTGTAFIMSTRNSTSDKFLPWQQLLASGANSGSGSTWPLFGSGVAIAGDGSSLFVGQPHTSDSSAGHVHVYIHGVWSWVYSQTITGSSRYFGSGASACGDGRDLLVGSFGSNVTTAAHYQRWTGSSTYYKVDDIDTQGYGAARAYALITSSDMWLAVGELGSTNAMGTVYSVDTICPTQAPTRAPTTHPTASPTTSPTKRPTKAPTTRPTKVPTVTPTQRPTANPTHAPTASPTTSPTISPTALPTLGPSAHPTTTPTEAPTGHPTTSPTQHPTNHPTLSPTPHPTTSPTAGPTNHPTQAPTQLPTTSPTQSPTIMLTQAPTQMPTTPTHHPTTSPTTNPTPAPTQGPTTEPTTRPTEAPTAAPSTRPTTSPTPHPTTSPTQSPTDHPTAHPTTAPTQSPTTHPTQSPTQLPTTSPTQTPTAHPTTMSPTSTPTQMPTHSPTAPTQQPTTSPTEAPTQSPTTTPTQMPTAHPTTMSPTITPTESPTQLPTKFPTQSPTSLPTEAPTLVPTAPTTSPTTVPSQLPTTSPTEPPTRSPTTSPTQMPTLTPTAHPTTMSPTLTPTQSPSQTPTKSPTAAPTLSPTAHPTLTPSQQPTKTPSEMPTKSPSAAPTLSPTPHPTVTPSQQPTKTPSEMPTKSPSTAPTLSPTGHPTLTPSAHPTTTPSEMPTKSPTTAPTQMPTQEPTQAPTSPTTSPTTYPTAHPTLYPTQAPTQDPTQAPTQMPTQEPTQAPTRPTTSPTTYPTALPTLYPTHAPTQTPTQGPTTPPTTSPTTMPTQGPTHHPTLYPTQTPSTAPTQLPTTPTMSPSTSPTQNPTTSPTTNPTTRPTANPTTAPTLYPTTSPTQMPSESPTKTPTQAPTMSPTTIPTNAPSARPTTSPTAQPTTSPTERPTTHPTTSPTARPSAPPTTSPTAQPTTRPTERPTMSPTTSPTARPSAPPTTSPTQAPTTMPTEMPTTRPTTSPTSSPTKRPTLAPTQKPTFLGGGVMIRTLSICATPSPTLTPTAAPTSRPTVTPTEAPTRTVLTDCAVGDWTASSTCSASCGPGTQTYTREVTTWPAHGGAACPALNQTISCSSGPCILNVTAAPSFVDSTHTKYINPTDKVTLGVSTSSLSSSSAMSYVWSSTGDALSSSNLLTSSANQFLVIKMDSLTAGSAYTLTIKVTDGYGYATSTMGITVNQAPNSGSVYAEPESGTALSTSFKFWTEEWVDPEEHYPLYYTFTTSVLGVPVTLGAKSNVSGIDDILLPMPASGSQVTIYYTVADYYGASTSKSKNVTVTSTITSANAAGAVKNQTKLAASLIADGTPTSALKAVVIMSSSAISLDTSISASADGSTTAASVRENFLTLAKNLSSFAANSEIGSSIVTSLASCVAKATSVPSEMSSTAVTSALSVLSSVTSHATTLSGAVGTAGTQVIQAVSNLVDAGLLNSTSSSCGSSSLTTVTNVVKAVHNASAQNMAPGEDATSFSSNNINIKSQVLPASASKQKTSVKNPTSSRTTSFAVPAAWTSSCGDGGLGMLSVQWSSNKYGCVQSGASSAVPKGASSSELSLSCAPPGYTTSFNKTKKVAVTITNAKKPKGRRLSTPETFTVECALGSTTHHKLTCTTDAGSYVYYANCTGANEDLTYTCPTGYTTSKCVAWNTTTSSWSSDSCVTTSNTTAIALGIVTCDCGGTDLNIGLVEGDNKFYGESLTRTAVIDTYDDIGGGGGSGGGSEKKKSSAGAAVGGAIGGILVLAIAGVVVYARKTGRPQWIGRHVGHQRILAT